MHPHSHTTRHHKPPARSGLIAPLLAHLHDTDLWANYLPHIPPGFYVPAVIGVGMTAGATRLLWMGQTLWGWLGFGLGLLLIAPLIAVAFFVRWRTGFRMGLRKLILDWVPWRGDERVLDVGCGNGMLLNGAAQRLTSGKATGIDIWAEHGGGGTLELLWQNARAEKVADRIEFKEADARQMPFENETFDVVLSSGAMHHISRTQADFDSAIHEILRVLKPGGRVAIVDVAHMVNACASRFRAAGLTCEVREIGQYMSFEMAVVFGRREA